MRQHTRLMIAAWVVTTVQGFGNTRRQWQGHAFQPEHNSLPNHRWSQYSTRDNSQQKQQRQQRTTPLRSLASDEGAPARSKNRNDDNCMYAENRSQHPHKNNNDGAPSPDTIRRNVLLSSAALLTSGLWSPPGSTSSAKWAVRPPSANALSDPENRIIDVFDRTAPSVVFIDTFAERQDAFSTNVMEVPLGTGTGFVWDTDGHIGTYISYLRNNHHAAQRRRRVGTGLRLQHVLDTQR